MIIAKIFGETIVVYILSKILIDIYNYIQRKDVNKQSIFLAMVIGVTLSFLSTVLLIMWAIPILNKIMIHLF